MVKMEQTFDSLFSEAAQRGDLGDLQRAVVSRMVPVTSGSQGNSRQGSRGGSGQGSRGSPVRKPTMNTLCPSNPMVTELQGGAASRSHSMRDQTGYAREKYQHRRLSIKNSSPAALGSRSGSRNNSLPGNDVEVTRQFLATNKKVINRGDSFKRKERPVPVIRSKVEVKVNGCGGECS